MKTVGLVPLGCLMDRSHSDGPHIRIQELDAEPACQDEYDPRISFSVCGDCLQSVGIRLQTLGESGGFDELPLFQIPLMFVVKKV